MQWWPLREIKTALQQARKTQIVARLMVEELAFHGVRNVNDVATCLAGYDQTCLRQHVKPVMLPSSTNRKAVIRFRCAK